MAFVLVKNGTLIDCTGAKPVANGAVLIEDKKIVSVGALESLEIPKDDITVLDAAGGTILPGLIDSHVHIMSQDHSLEKMLSEPFSYRFYQAPIYMKRTIDAGITTVRDAGGADLGTKKAIDDGLIVGPRLKISVNALSITGGHGDGWMPSGIDTNLFESYPGFPPSRCDGVEEVRKRTRELLRAGAEVIKICSTGGVMSPTDKPEYTQFSPEELRVIVQEAQYHGNVKVMSHAQGTEGIKQALLAGIHSIEHGIYLDDEVIELMLKKGTFLVPTLLAPVSIIENPELEKILLEVVIQKARQVAAIHKESIAKAYQAGVKIAMGTDAGVMPHGMNLRELGLLCDIGMTPMEALLATTKVAAECLEWQEKIGTLEPGKLGDVVVVKGDPLKNIRLVEDQTNIQVVIKEGKILKDIL